MKNFFIGRAIVFFVLLVIFIAVFAYKSYAPSAPQPERSAPPTFAWRFAEADSLNPDGNPETDVFLDARYADGTMVTKLVDTSHGSCAPVPNSEDIQCYGAGLGARYRIMEGASSYVIQRQMFEEGSPEYDPPVNEYVTIAEYPL